MSSHNMANDKKTISDFIVIDHMINAGVQVVGGTNVAQVQAGGKGKKGQPDKAARITMLIDNDTAQKLMQSMHHGTQEYVALMFVVPYNEFVVTKNRLEAAGPSAEELAFNAGRERIKHPDFDYVYETFEEYQAKKHDRKGD